jgi:hypothetical protein
MEPLAWWELCWVQCLVYQETSLGHSRQWEIHGGSDLVLGGHGGIRWAQRNRLLRISHSVRSLETVRFLELMHRDSVFIIAPYMTKAGCEHALR